MSNNLESIPIIDAHQHFWDLDNNYYPFLSDNYDKNFFLGDYSSLKRNYLPKDYFLDYRHAEMTVDQLIDKESIQ